MNNEWNDEVVVDVHESDITVDQAYDATSENPQSGTAVAQAVAQAGGTVDQTYNASSANAQSGTAVAGAIAGVKQVPASTSADADKVLTVNPEGVPGWATAQGGGGSSVKAGEGLVKLTDALAVDLAEGGLLQIGTVILGYAGESDGVYTVPSEELYRVWYIRTENSTFRVENYPSGGAVPSKAYLYIADGANLNSASNVGKYTPLSGELSFNISGTSSNPTIQPYNISLSDQIYQQTVTMERGTWASLTSRQTLYIMFAFVFNYQYFTFSSYNFGNLKYLTTDKKLKAVNPLPEYSAEDAGKVLQVQADGSLAWVTLS